MTRGLLCLRRQVLYARLVDRDYSAEAAKKGDIINIPKSRAAAISDVVPGPVPPTPADSNFDNIQMALPNWKHSDFQLSDKDLNLIDKDSSFMPMQVEEAMKIIVETINVEIGSQYKSVYGYVGTAGTIPFSTDEQQAIDARKTLHQQLAPRSGRVGILNFDAEAKALKLAAFRDASQSGKDSVVIEGELGKFFGINWFAEDNVPTHTAGTGSGYLVNNGAGLAVGDTTAVVDTGIGTLVVGDIIDFAGHAQTYVIDTLYSPGGAGTISFQPPLVAAVADNAAITKRASHTVNLVFAPGAFQFASRPLVQNKVIGSNRKMMTMADKMTGIVLRLEMLDEYKQTAWDFDVLWGSKCLRPEFATRIAG